MPQEGQPQGKMKIRVFYVSTIPGSQCYKVTDSLHKISEEFEVSYLWKLDPIYHELCFTDLKGIRHQFVGLPYHVTEEIPASGGIDAQV